MMSDQDNELSSLYKKQAKEQPSTALDKQILDLAKQSLTKRNSNTVRQYLPYSAAASVMLVAVLVTQFSPDQVIQSDEVPLYDTQPMLQDTAPQYDVSNSSADQPMATKQELSPTAKMAPAARVVEPKKLAQETQTRGISRSSKAKVMSKATNKPTREALLTQIAKVIDNDQKESLKLLSLYVDHYGKESLPKDYQRFLAQHNTQSERHDQ